MMIVFRYEHRSTPIYGFPVNSLARDPNEVLYCIALKIERERRRLCWNEGRGFDVSLQSIDRAEATRGHVAYLYRIPDFEHVSPVDRLKTWCRLNGIIHWIHDGRFYMTFQAHRGFYRPLPPERDFFGPKRPDGWERESIGHRILRVFHEAVWHGLFTKNRPNVAYLDIGAMKAWERCPAVRQMQVEMRQQEPKDVSVTKDGALAKWQGMWIAPTGEEGDGIAVAYEPCFEREREARAVRGEMELEAARFTMVSTPLTEWLNQRRSQQVLTAILSAVDRGHAFPDAARPPVPESATVEEEKEAAGGRQGGAAVSRAAEQSTQLATRSHGSERPNRRPWWRSWWRHGQR